MNWLDILSLNLSEESHYLAEELKLQTAKAKSLEDANLVALAAALASGQTALALEISSNGILSGNQYRELIIKTVQEQHIGAVKEEFFSASRSKGFTAYRPDMVEKLNTDDEIRIYYLASLTANLVIGKYGIDQQFVKLADRFGYTDMELYNFAGITANIIALKSAI